LNELLSLFSGKRPKIELSENNGKILKVFKNKGWITGFDIDSSNPQYYRARGRRILKEENLSIELL
jgi:hypothetical protein